MICLDIFRPLKEDERLPVLEHKTPTAPPTTKTRHSKKKEKVSTTRTFKICFVFK